MQKRFQLPGLSDAHCADKMPKWRLVLALLFQHAQQIMVCSICLLMHSSLPNRLVPACNSFVYTSCPIPCGVRCGEEKSHIFIHPASPNILLQWCRVDKKKEVLPRKPEGDTRGIKRMSVAMKSVSSLCACGKTLHLLTSLGVQDVEVHVVFLLGCVAYCLSDVGHCLLSSLENPG